MNKLHLTILKKTKQILKKLAKICENLATNYATKLAKLVIFVAKSGWKFELEKAVKNIGETRP